MRLRFDPTFDAGAWPDVLAGREAVAGEAVVGPMGLAGILELALGLGGHRSSDAERAAALVPRALAEEGFWSPSARADPLGTARQLLAMRDDLCMAGWRGEAPTRRLAQLSRLTAGLNPGFPDRLEAICNEMEGRQAQGLRRGKVGGAATGHPPGARESDWPIGRVERLAPVADLPGLWHRTFRGLETMGTAIVDVDLQPLVGAGDLEQAHRALDGPRHPDVPPTLTDVTGDASLQLLRPDGVLQAAEEVAAWLACQDDLATTVIVNPDPVLDAALARFGLPTTGARATQRAAPHLQVLPLALQMRWGPQDPAAARRFLLLPATPVPAAVARRLVVALDTWPAVDSDEWRRARSEGLAALGDPDTAARADGALDELFAPVASHDEALDASAIRRTCDVVARWLAADSADAPHAGGPARAIQRQVELLATLLDLSGQSALDAAQLDRYVAAATEAALRLARAPAPFPAAAGLAVVGDPGGVVGPARRVVWWNFTRDSEPPLGRRPLAPKDEAALADLGAAMPDFGVRALARAARYRRPLAMATEALLLVCPATNAGGAESHPHPLWDEVSSCLGEAEEARLTVPRPVVPVPRPGGPSQPELMAAPPRPPPVSWRRLEAPPGPRGVWQARGAIAVDRIESPSSLGTLVGCPFRWTALYVGGIRAGLAGEPPRDSAILGSLGHKIIGQVLALRPGSPAQAGEAAATVFDTEGPRMNATLFLPGRDAARSEARRLVTSGAAAITKVLQDAGLHVEAVEISLAAEADIGPVRGRADLVLGPRRAVIDLKLSGLNHRRKEIRDGTAYQLATYGRLLARDGEFPPVGYYVLRQQALLSTAPGPFGEITPINGPGPEATWRGLVAAVEARRTALSAGVVAAPGSEDEVPDDVEKASLEGGRLSLPPQCHFCDLSPLCGRAFGRAAKRESTSWSGTRSTRRSHPRSRR